MITVWEFRPIDGKQVVISVRPYYVDDLKYHHKYQRIIYRGSRSGYITLK